MLDLAKIQSIAQSYSPQELFAALVWQRRFHFLKPMRILEQWKKSSSENWVAVAARSNIMSERSLIQQTFCS